MQSLVFAHLFLALVNGTLLFPLLLSWIPIKAIYQFHIFFHLTAMGLFFFRVDRRRWASLLGGLLLLYGAWTTADSVWQTHPLQWLRITEIALVPLNFFTFLVFLPALLSRNAYLRVFRATVYAFALLTLVAIYLSLSRAHSFAGFPMAKIPEGRGEGYSLLGILTHHNVVGTFFAPLPALALYLLLTLRLSRLHQVILGLAGILVTLNMLLSFSRSSQLATAISLLPAIWLGLHSRWRWPLLAAAGGAMGAGALYLTTQPLLLKYVNLGLNPAGRNIYWRDTLLLIAERPWVGYGLFNASTTSGDTPHNVFLTHLLYFGIPGLGLFGAILLEIFRRIATSFSMMKPFPLAVWLPVFTLLGVLVQGMFEYYISYPLFFANSVFMLLMGYLVSGHAASSQAGATRA